MSTIKKQKEALCKRLNELTSNVGDMALKRRVHRVIEELELSPGDFVLDCGCGDGFYLKTIYGLGVSRAVGLDFDKEKLGFLKNHCSHIPLINGKICSLPFRKEAFDKIFCSEVLEHLPDERSALKEVHRILKPGGKLVVTVPNRNYPFFWDPVNWMIEHISSRHIQSGFWAGIWNEHLRLYSPQEVEALVRESGFRVNYTELLTHFCMPFNHYVLNFLKKILKKNILPESIQNSGDKFCNDAVNQSPFVKKCYALLNRLDLLNDRYPNYKTSVGILVTATKT